LVETKLSQRVIIFGVSGVGKTAACRDYVARHPEVAYLNVGEVLSEATGLSPEEMYLSSEEEILARQAIFSHILDRNFGSSARKLVIDAHSVIDTDGGSVTIPVELIQSLQPTGIVLLESDPKEVQRRRLRDSRFRPDRSIGELQSQIAYTRKVVEGYSDHLNIPLIVTCTGPGFRLDEVIKRLS
jgi:adenylate kinase